MSNTSTSSKLVSVFCAARDVTNTIYTEAATELGVELTKANYGLIYGGGSHGLMGCVARSVNESSGDVISVVPEALTKIDTGVSFGSKVIVESIAERKKMVCERAVAFVAMPGGFGVMDELFEVITLKTIGMHSKPIVVVNTDGFFDEIKAFIDKAANKGFVDEDKQNVVVFCSTPKEAVEAIATHKA
ncbi:hypothetical protein LPJ53_002568 [Coemansia erecta]|uniref:Cytokinin riboside 5'-monophosphate phosphoribohydrolase n=1 Tax=Coemansia erecta TaxID=147472 RepID=A0A9W7Y3Z2_9FUNG|nr:hypothetical protein LPJ53_002568 [Coemansia erecta]